MQAKKHQTTTGNRIYQSTLGYLRITLTLFLTGTCLTANAVDKPNLLLIYVDDLGLGDLGHTGHPVIKTPNLDALAGSGLTLSNYYGSHTGPESRAGFRLTAVSFCVKKNSPLPNCFVMLATRLP